MLKFYILESMNIKLVTFGLLLGTQINSLENILGSHLGFIIDRSLGHGRDKRIFPSTSQQYVLISQVLNTDMGLALGRRRVMGERKSQDYKLFTLE